MHLGKRLYSLLLFIAVSAIAGILVAGLIVPMITLMSGATQSMASFVTTLPADLDPTDQPERSRLLNADKSVLAYFYEQNRWYVTLDKISDNMKNAQLAIEDHRFYEHGAIDLQGTLRALLSTSQGVTQGGSSLTQQYVRLVLVQNAQENNDAVAEQLAKENTIARKIRELRYAIGIEEQFSKDEILERYLNISYYGDGAYGVEAAARHFFNVSAANLSIAQAAMLAGLVREPNATNPVKDAALAIERRNTVLDRMLEYEMITEAEYYAARAETFDPANVRVYPKGCVDTDYPFICDFAYQTLLQTPSLGDTMEERENKILRGGLTIQTQIDLKIQKKAQKTISKYISAKDPAISVIVFLEPGTGQILAMAQSRPTMGTNIKKGETFYNYATSRSMNGADGFQGGSTFKAYVAAAALDEGLGASWTTNVQGRMDFEGKIYESCDGSYPARGSNGHWWVVGSSGSHMNMYEGARRSVNGYFVQLEMAVGMCPVVKMAKKLGLEMANGEDIMQFQWMPSFTLGAAEITPLSAVEAYATFAARGIHCEPVLIKSITTRTGTSLEPPSANCKRVISKDVADGVNKLLVGSITGGTSSPTRIYGIDMAGKTGTVDSNKAIWQIAYNPSVVGAAVLSVDNNQRFKSFWKSHSRLLGGVTLPSSGTYISGGSGSVTGRMLLRPVFETAIKQVKPGHFSEPSASIMRGEQVSVPGCEGRSVSSCKAVLEDAGFSAYTAKKKVYSDTVEEGKVVSTDPSGRASKRSMVEMNVSKGPKPVEPDPNADPNADPNQQQQQPQPAQQSLPTQEAAVPVKP
ncbi:MAG: transglycosylase domain-containing protein [Propionibacteriaceae bacterium]|nr:transglycosylase domain-containing protein [Propionibacteriaceae bacterium]